MSKRKKEKEKSTDANKLDLGQLLKENSNVVSLALEDQVPNRINYIEFFDCLTSFLRSYNFAIVGIDKETYVKIQKERAFKNEKLMKKTKLETDEAKAEEAIIENEGEVDGDEKVSEERGD
jgi:hypothetical protein